MPFQRVRVSGGHLCEAEAPTEATAETALPLGERKTCLRIAFLMGSPVKSAFALLLTRVTESRTSKFMRLEVYKCKER